MNSTDRPLSPCIKPRVSTPSHRRRRNERRRDVEWEKKLIYDMGCLPSFLSIFSLGHGSASICIVRPICDKVGFYGPALSSQLALARLSSSMCTRFSIFSSLPEIWNFIRSPVPTEEPRFILPNNIKVIKTPKTLFAENWVMLRAWLEVCAMKGMLRQADAEPRAFLMLL